MDGKGERTRLCAERGCRSPPFGTSVCAALVSLLTLFQLVGIATGLQYLHSYEPHPIYHGDLKGVCLFNITFTWLLTFPLQFNVLISDHGCPLLADFGFAFIVNSSFSMDVEGSRGGTLHWMGPEYFGVWEDSTAAEGDACVATAEKDVWAFGMTVLVRLPCLSSYSLLDVSRRNSLRDTAPSTKSIQSPNSSFACEVATLAQLTKPLTSV